MDVDFPWLTALVAVPAVGAAVVAALPRSRELLVRRVALGVSFAVLLLTALAVAQYDVGGSASGEFQLAETYEWIPSFGVHWALGVNGIGLSLIALAAVVTPVVILAGWTEPDAGPDGTGRSAKGFFAAILVLEAMIIGAFAAVDVLLFYVLFEAMLVPMYVLIGMYGGPRRSYAATKFLLYNLFGGLVMLAAVIGLYVESGSGSGDRTFLLTDLAELELSSTTQGWLFAGFMLAFAIKAPLWPFHTWLPDAASEATPSTAAYLSGVMDKVGTFGMVHLCLPLFPLAVRDFAPIVVTLAVISVLYGALLAMGQTDLKRLVAYASISHFGFIVLGIFVLTSRGNSGATLYMVNHGLATVALFVVVGFMIARRRSSHLYDYGGVQGPAPVLSGVLLFAALATASLPGLATFVSEFLVLLGAFERYRVAGVAAALGIVLGAIYMLVMYQRTMTGPVRPHTEGMADLRGREIAAVAPLIALILAIGLYPKPALDVINDGVTPTLEQVGVTDPGPVAEGTADQ